MLSVAGYLHTNSAQKILSVSGERQEWLYWREWSNMTCGGYWLPAVWFWEDEVGFIPLPKWVKE